MSSIVLSAAVRQNLLALQNTASMMATTQNDLATGKKVNSALDNPTNFFTASGLDNRAGDISNLLDGISNGVQVLQAANTGITSLQSLVSQAQSIANQALQSPIGYSTKSNISTTIAGATSSNLLGTPSYTNDTFTGSVVNNHAATPAPITTSTALSGTGTGDYISGLTGGTDDLVVNGKTISFTSTGSTTVSSTGASINVTSGTLADVVSAINTITGSPVGSPTATITAGSLVISTGTTASGVTIGGTSAALTALGLGSGGTDSNTSSTGGVTGLTAAGTNLVGTATTPLGGEILKIASTGGGIPTNLTFGTGPNEISTLNQLNTALASNNLQATLTSAGVLTISTTNDYASQTIGTVSGSIVGGAFPTGTAGAAPVADPNSQATRATLVSQYNAILTQISNTASDSSYNGINLLAGDQLQLTFNETGKSKVDITGVDFSAAGLGLSNLVQGTAFIDNASTNNVLSTLQTVSSTLRAQASAFGSNLSVVQTRQDFNQNLINVLQTGSANLTQADINEEAANSQALSTRQSLSVSALSLANQAQQSVLQLLR